MTTDQTPWFVADAVGLLRGLRTLHLATVGDGEAPLASVAPFVAVDAELHVYLSALAAHTANLRARRRASVLLARDEAECPDPFARPRFAALCRVREEPRRSAHWDRVLDRMQARLGETAATVRELPDFALFRLAPVEGTVVSGFARAHRLDMGELGRIVRAASD